MMNSELNDNEVVGGGTDTPASDKQLSGAPRKTALRDVQNENLGSIHKPQETLLPGGGKPNADAIKVCGTKRLTPERPSSSQGFQSLAYNGTNENVMNARRRFELELGRGRLQSTVEKYSGFSESKNMSQLQQGSAQKMTETKGGNLPHVLLSTPSNLAPTMAFPSGGPSVPSPSGKHSSSTPAAKASPQLPRTVDCKSPSDRLRTDRFILLQNFLKQCDEANQREYIQMLLHLSPADLSDHAVKLETRAIQLTIEEGNEMRRMKELNILAKSLLMNNSLQSTRLLQSNKR